MLMSLPFNKLFLNEKPPHNRFGCILKTLELCPSMHVDKRLHVTFLLCTEGTRLILKHCPEMFKE